MAVRHPGWAVLVVVVVLAGCGGGGAGPRAASTSRSGRPGATARSSVAPSRPTSPSPTSSSAAPSVFVGTVAPIDPATATRMTGVSWRSGCPVPLEALALLRLSYRGFDGAVRTGELVVAAAWADRVLGVLRSLFEAGFPIERMQLIDDYGASDDASVLANNTSAFNCRAVTGGTSWSRHAYGTAIDVNPRQNPYVYPDGRVLDPAAEPYRDRSRQEPGMIHAGDAAYSAFAAIGWRWGGFFTDTPDPQHFDTAP